MPITVVATAEFAGGASGGTSGSFDSTGANCIAVFLSYGGSPTVSDNKGNTFTAGDARTNTASGRWYYCLGASVGTGHTVTIGGGTTVSSCSVFALAGVGGSGSFSSPGGTDFSGATSDALGVAYTPPSNGCIVIAGLATTTETISGVSAGSGWTLGEWATGVGGTNYGNITVYQIQTTATEIAAGNVVASWTGSTGGVHIPAIFAPAPSSALTISSPTRYAVRQRSGTTGSITVTGTYSGSPTSLEARFNGGTWTTIVASPSGGTYSGTLTGQAQGQGTLEVRFSNDTGITASVLDIGIGDVFIVAGDSISEGRGTNAQTYTHATLKATAFRQDDAWINANDPVDTGTNIGSQWPLLATQIMASQSVPVAFISVGTGSTDVAGSNNQWAKPNSAYSELTAQVTASGVNSVRGVLMHLGPNAVVNASTLSQATYNAALDTLASNLAADVVGAPKLNIGIFGEVSTGSPPDRVAALNNLRAGIIEAIDDNANVETGPCLIELDYSDGVHPQTDAELQAVAARWWLAISQTYYSGSGGRGPRISSATFNEARTTITVVFDRALKTGLTHSTGCWAVSDNGTSRTVTGVAYDTNPNALVITISTAATGPDGTGRITFAGGDTAVGAVVPRSADMTMPVGSAVSLPAEPFYSATVSEPAGPATAITLTGPSSGVNGVASTNFTVGANGVITGTVVVTPGAGGGGGTFSPTSVSISSGTPTATFTYTPASAGAKSISVTNDGGLTNPSAITYTVSAGSATTFPLVSPELAGLTGFSGVVLSASAPGTGVTVIRTFTSLSFDGSGNASVSASGLSLTAGAVRYIVGSQSDGDTAPATNPRCFQGPVAAA
jgi:hypothetical protein